MSFFFFPTSFLYVLLFLICPSFLSVFICSNRIAEADLNGGSVYFTRLMDEGPSGAGNMVSGMQIAEDEILNQLRDGSWEK